MQYLRFDRVENRGGSAESMNQTFRSGISFFAATIVVSGGIYMIDRYADWKPSGNQKPMREIKGSVGAVSPIDNNRSEAGAPLNDLPITSNPAAPKKSGGAIFRCQVDGETVYADVPCGG